MVEKGRKQVEKGKKKKVEKGRKKVEKGSKRQTLVKARGTARKRQLTIQNVINRVEIQQGTLRIGELATLLKVPPVTFQLFQTFDR